MAERLWAYLPLPCPLGGIGDLERWMMVGEPPPLEELLAAAGHAVREGREVFAQIGSGDFGDIDRLSDALRDLEDALAALVTPGPEDGAA